MSNETLIVPEVVTFENDPHHLFFVDDPFPDDVLLVYRDGPVDERWPGNGLYVFRGRNFESLTPEVILGFNRWLKGERDRERRMAGGCHPAEHFYWHERFGRNGCR